MLKALRKKFVRYIPDKIYYQLVNLRVHRYHLDFANPKRFNEKIHWLMLYDRQEKYTRLADKYSIREYVANEVGEQYLNTLHGVYEDVDEIIFDDLPEKFVLKATHGCGYNIICPDKNQLDWPKTKMLLKKWLGTNMFWFGREWVYKNIQPRIICEAFLESLDGFGLLDYKFFCFNGEPKLVQVDYDRFTNHTRNMYNIDWELQPFCYLYVNSRKEADKPENLDEMITVAKRLSAGIPFCRVDLYVIGARIVFGEITFYPEGGNGKFFPEKYDFIIGDLLILPGKPR